jgi:hypothetical protein
MFNKLRRSNSTVSSRSGSSSLATLSDIVHEEDEVLPHPDLDLQNWSLPKVNKKEVYDQTSWVSSVFQTEHKVKTVERAYALNKSKDETLLFRKREMKEFKNKGFRFIHIGLIQVGIKPLTRRGINASVLLRLIDARFTNENQARLGMVEANVSHGPFWFNANPDLTLSLDDGAPEKALTLRINTSGYHMIEGSRPLALVYRIYYKLFKTNLNPQALIKDPQDQTLLLQTSREDINVNVPKMIKWEDIKLPDEWDLPNEMPPTVQTPINIADQDNLESVLQYHDGTVKLKFDHSKPRMPPLIKYQSSRRSFSGSSSTNKRDQDLDKEKDLEKYLNELNLNKQKEKNKNVDIKQKGVKSTSSQVESAYYTVDDNNNNNNKTNEAVGSDNESFEPTPS